jgi:hypothetical protein
LALSWRRYSLLAGWSAGYRAKRNKEDRQMNAEMLDWEANTFLRKDLFLRGWVVEEVIKSKTS